MCQIVLVLLFLALPASYLYVLAALSLSTPFMLGALIRVLGKRMA